MCVHTRTQITASSLEIFVIFVALPVQAEKRGGGMREERIYV